MHACMYEEEKLILIESFKDTLGIMRMDLFSLFLKHDRVTTHMIFLLHIRRRRLLMAKAQMQRR